MRGRTARGGRSSRGRSGRNGGRGKRPESSKTSIKAEMSPIDGIEMLYPTANGRKTNILKVKKSFCEKMQTEHGLHAQFLDDPDVGTDEDEIPEIDFNPDDYTAVSDPGHIRRKILESQMQERIKSVRERRDVRFKLWSTIKSICSTESWSKIETWE